MKTKEEILLQNLSPVFVNKASGDVLLKQIKKAMEEYASQFRTTTGAKDSSANICTICHENYVDSANGYDTCESCLRNI